MKVLQVINSLSVGGAEKLIVDSISLYKEKGIDIDVLVLKKRPSFFLEEVEKKNVVYSLTEGSIYSPLLILKIIPFLKKYDIIHAHLFPTLYWVVLAKIFSFSKTKVIYTEHSTSNGRREKWFFKILDKYIYSRLDFVGCISSACYLNLIKHLECQNATIKVINNGIDLRYFNNIYNTTDSFFSKDSFVLIQVSSFRTQKDQKTVIKALALLPDNIKLILVGDGVLKQDCEELVRRLGLDSRVVFAGKRSDIAQLLKYSDLAIQSSVYEGFGLAAIEAMAMGRAVIASDVEGLRDVVKDYGVLFPKGDYEILAMEIMKFYKDLEYKEKIEKKCKLRSYDFDIRAMVSKYIDVYKEN